MEMRKRLLTYVMVFVMIFTLIGGGFITASNSTAKSSRFKDVPPSHWANTEVEALAEEGIVEGSDETHFRPGKSVTRAEFVKMLVLALEIEPLEYGWRFFDVYEDSWFATYVEAAYQNNLASGTSPDFFSPKKSITREQMAVMVMNAYKYLTGQSAKDVLGKGNSSLPFKDAKSISSWAVDSVKAAYKKGFISGMTKNTYAPKAIANRAQAACMIYRLLKATSWGPTPTPDPNATPTPTPVPVTKREIRVATTCVKIRKSTPSANLTEILKMVDKTASATQPDILLLSEALYHRGTDVGIYPEAIPGTFTNAMIEKAKQYNMYIAYNMLEKCADGKNRNVNVLLDRTGKIVGKYYKVKIPPEEIDFTTAGKEYNVFNTEFGKIGMMVCYDLAPEFNGQVARKISQNGAELILVSSIGEYWQEAKKAAKDNKVYIAISGQDRYREPMSGTAPLSGIFGPDGSTLAGVQDPSSTRYPYKDGDGSFTYYDINLGPVKNTSSASTSNGSFDQGQILASKKPAA